MPGLAVAMLKVGAWANLLLGVGVALGISWVGLVPPGPAGPYADVARIGLELFSAFEGFIGWALLLVLATMAEQLDQLHAAMTRAATAADSDST
jgi:hypothetical protein